MRVTEKGQVTIPKHIRDKMGIVPGSEVEFVDLGNGEAKVLRKAQPQRDQAAFEEVLNGLAGTADFKGMSTDDYMLLIRGERDDVDPH
ncbi:MAG: AbrB/MazE/SpoVT family DNA-binding domain-containing protein [Pseudomonadota bacterium]